jgi:tetratricopeptide (TPR) repeat protein
MASPNKPRILPPSHKRRNLFYAAFIIINLFLSCYYLDTWLAPNAVSRALTVMTLSEDKTIVIDKYKDYSVDISLINNHYYSNKAPLTSFVVYPFYGLYKTLGLPEIKESALKKYPLYMDYYNPNSDDKVAFPQKSSTISMVLILGDIICGAIPFVIALVLSLFAIKKSSSKISPVVIVMLSFYASFLFTYAGTYTGHVLSGALALAGYILIKKKNYVLSGIMVGLAIAIEFPVGILVPVWALLIYLNEKKISKPLLFAAGLIPGLFIVLFYNYHLTGSITKTSYNYELIGHKQQAQDVGFYFPTFQAFWGLIFSTYRGVLYYTPVLLLMLWYVLKNGYSETFSKIKNKLDLINIGVNGIKNYLFVTIVAYLLLYSSYYQWAGGWAFGPRYLIPLVIIMLYEGVLYLSSRPFSAYVFYALTGLGLVFTWMDKSTKIYQVPDDPAHFGNPIFNVIIPDFFKHKFNTNLLPVFMFDSNPVIAIYLWPIFFVASLIVLTIWYSKLYPARKNKTNVYMPLACLFVLYIIILIPRNREWKNNFTPDFFGDFGGWKHYSIASDYQDSADGTNDPAKKAQYYSHAITEYKNVIPYSPAFHVNYFKLGLCYYSMGDGNDAIQSFKKALEYSPKYSEPANYLGIVYFNKAQYDTAIKYFDIAYTADSNNTSALMNMGAAYQNKNNYSLAFHYDSLALKKDSGNKQTLNNLATMHNALGIQYINNNELDKAMKEFSIALNCDPNSANAIGDMGVVYQKMGDIEKAKNCFQQAVAKDPNVGVFAQDLQMLNQNGKSK